MTRNIKAFSLALLGAMVLGATAAAPVTTAQDLFTAEAETTVLTANSTGVSIFRFTGAKLDLDCGTPQISGTLENGAGELTVFPAFTGEGGEPTECSGSVSKAILDVNGCDYRLTGETTQEDEGKSDAIVHIMCPEGKAINTTGPFGCTTKIPAQTPTVGGVTYTNEAGGKIKVIQTLTGLTYAAPGFGCSLLGLPSHGNDLDLVGSFVLEGFEDLGSFKEGAKISIEVS